MASGARRRGQTVRGRRSARRPPRASCSPSRPPRSSPPCRPRPPPAVDDWRHEWEVLRLVTYLQEQVPVAAAAMVYDLGDSIARESIISDSIWTTQLANRAGRAGKAAPRAYTLAGHNQTFGMDEQLVGGRSRRPPPGSPRASCSSASASAASSARRSRRRASTSIRRRPESCRPSALGAARVRRPQAALARAQEGARPALDGAALGGVPDQPRQELRRPSRASSSCARPRGLRPVLLDQPLDMKVVGSGLDRPRLSIRSGCDTLVKRYGAVARRQVRALHQVGRHPHQVLLGHAPPARPRRASLAVAPLGRAGQAPARPHAVASAR